MKTNRFRLTWLLVLLALISASLACNLPSVNISNSDGVDQPAVSVSTPEIAFDQNTPSGGEQIAITLTEGQLNAIVQQAVQTDPNQTIQDMQLHLQPGEVALSGIVNQEGLSLPLRLTLAISPDGQGGLSYQVISANVGPLPLPQTMRDQIESRLNQYLQEPVRQLTNNIFIEEITIGDGILNLTGQIQ